MGLVELISVTTWSLRGIGTRSARQSLVGAGTKNASLSPAEAGTREATAIMEKVATEAGVSNKKGAENLKAEAKGPTAPLADLPPHHLVEEVEAEAEAGSRSKSPRNGPRDARERLNEYRSEYIGPKCFGRMIREEPTPKGLNLKLPENLKHYDGSERPDTWIKDYFNALCWFDLKITFEKHFRGTYKRPATTSDLQACIQKKGETSRNFLTRWLATRNECKNVDNRTAMHAFIGGLQRGGLLRHKLTCLINENNLTLDDMIGIASTHTAADDNADGELTATAIPMHQQKKNRDNGSGSNNNKRKNPPTTRRAEDPTWLPWRSNAEVREAEEAADVEAEPAGASSALTRSPLLGSALPKHMKNTGTCHA
ncbi:hypothetical protein QYE76_009045 [Lolium multiflorum]|uniref:Retrotransposon gag domain-containing protein n=1 Tax=Lolium multiflorum TaxID=4521 RepID=A0AAD8TUB5_LOLMU|nr:hypothetical protein QYE76_009045 [Lolium multiflorum]